MLPLVEGFALSKAFWLFLPDAQVAMDDLEMEQLPADSLQSTACFFQQNFQFHFRHKMIHEANDGKAELRYVPEGGQ